MTPDARSSGTAESRVASGTSSNPDGDSAIEPTIVRPTPSRVSTRLATNAPARKPTFPSPSTRPIVVALIPSSRTK